MTDIDPKRLVQLVESKQAADAAYRALRKLLQYYAQIPPQLRPDVVSACNATADILGAFENEIQRCLNG